MQYVPYFPGFLLTKPSIIILWKHRILEGTMVIFFFLAHIRYTQRSASTGHILQKILHHRATEKEREREADAVRIYQKSNFSS